ncbi:hypothetical protein WA158_007908 [Blastocystis sp. Blastoise]
MSSKLLSRVHRSHLLEKLMTPKEAAYKFFKSGQTLGWSGFTPAGYPKVVPIALADRVEETKEDLKFEVFIGASVGSETEDRWAKLGMEARRFPYQTGKNIAAGINTGKIEMADTHLSMFAQNLGWGFYTKDNKHNPGRLDVAIIEATEILEDGGLVLGTGIEELLYKLLLFKHSNYYVFFFIGCTPEILSIADKIIIEVNTALPSLRGIHDIVDDPRPPHRKPYLISRVDDRVGSETIKVDESKVVAIVESTLPDNGRGFSAVDDTSKQIAGHIMDFLKNEVKQGRLPANLLPIQSGVGNIANAVVGGLVDSDFTHLNVWSEVLQDTVLDLIDANKVDTASGVSLSLSAKGFERFYGNIERYKPHCVLRPEAIANSCEFVRRLGVIAMNTPIEVDMYCHANSSLVGGTKIINGLGGSGDFLRNAYLSIMHTPSSRPSKTDPTGISCIVPMCAHIDHTEHDLDVIVTEQGLADVRGMSPRQRAQYIIKTCAHPDYKDQLLDYYKMAEKECIAKKAGHEPQLLEYCHKMHINLAKNGTMKLDKWN